MTKLRSPHRPPHPPFMHARAERRSAVCPRSGSPAAVAFVLPSSRRFSAVFGKHSRRHSESRLPCWFRRLPPAFFFFLSASGVGGDGVRSSSPSLMKFGCHCVTSFTCSSSSSSPLPPPWDFADPGPSFLSRFLLHYARCSRLVWLPLLFWTFVPEFPSRRALLRGILSPD